MTVKRRVVASASPPPAPITPSYDAVEVEFTRTKVVNPPNVPIPQQLEQIGGDPTTFREKLPYIPPHKHEISDVIGLRDELDGLRGEMAQQGGTLVRYIAVSAGHLANKKIPLPETPKDPTQVEAVLPFGTQQIYGIDFFVVGNEVRFSGLALATLLAVGDVVIFRYGV